MRVLLNLEIFEFKRIDRIPVKLTTLSKVDPMIQNPITIQSDNKKAEYKTSSPFKNQYQARSVIDGQLGPVHGGSTMKNGSFFDHLFYSHILFFATVSLIMLALSSFTFCGELHSAAEAGNLATVKSLLNDNPKLVFSKNDNGLTPLHKAVESNHKDVVELLLAKEAEVNAKAKNGRTPLHTTMEWLPNQDIIKSLLAKGAKINSKDNYGETPLHLAVRYHQEDIVEFLLVHGADVNANNKNGETPLHLAAKDNRNKQMAELLLNKGAEINAKDRLGITPLYLSVQNECSDIAELLLTKGAEVNAKGGDKLTSLHLAVMQGDLVKAKEFLKSNPNFVFKKDRIGSMPLHWATFNGRRHIAELLLTKGADVNAKDNKGETPLQKAAENGHRDIVELLLAKGADINSKDSYFGGTPLHWAAQQGHRDVVELLLAKGADVNAKDSYFGGTPLHWAVAQQGHRDVVELLLAKGADVNAKNKDGYTPLRYAKRPGREALHDLLSQRGGHE
jgi:ankyrin repeat protein